MSNKNKNTNSSNTVQVFWVALGSISSFLFTLISSMILSRYFAKDDYGTYRQVMYVYNTLLVVFTLGLPKAYSYFLPRVSDNEAKDLINKINRILFGLGTLLSVLIFAFSTAIAGFLKNPDLAYALKLFSPVPLLMLPTMGLDGILASYRRTQFSAMYTVLTRIFMLLCVALPVCFFSGNYISAIIGFVVASFFSCLVAMYLKFLPVKEHVADKTAIQYKEIFNFTLPLMYASLWGILISSADEFFISRYFGKEVFADFANGSLDLPFVAMVISACSTVLSPVFSKKMHENMNVKDAILPIWKSVFEKTVKTIYPLVIFFWFFADYIMIFLYSNKYETSADFFRIKVLINFLTLISYAPLILAMGATKYYAKVHMYGAISLIILEYLSIQIFNSPYVITMISVACQAGRIFAMLYFIAQYFKISLKELFPVKLMLSLLLPSIVFLYGIRIVLDYVFTALHLHNKLFYIVSGFAFYLVVYSIYVYVSKINYLYIITPLLKEVKKLRK